MQLVLNVCPPASVYVDCFPNLLPPGNKCASFEVSPAPMRNTWASETAALGRLFFVANRDVRPGGKQLHACRPENPPCQRFSVQIRSARLLQFIAILGMIGVRP
jgi:hypothetical protein